jgi:hypothetical protein
MCFTIYETKGQIMLLTLKEIADKEGLKDTANLRRACNANALVGIRKGRDWFVEESEYLKWVMAGRPGTQASKGSKRQ